MREIDCPARLSCKNVTGTNYFEDTSEQSPGGANLKNDISFASSSITRNAAPRIGPQALRSVNQVS
jgi:hypothetical protein